MVNNGFCRVVESGEFVWPWKQPNGLLVICGGAGGGGGGGGAFCLEDLNLYGARVVMEGKAGKEPACSGEIRYFRPRAAAAAMAVIAAACARASLLKVNMERGVFMGMGGMAGVVLSCPRQTAA